MKRALVLTVVILTLLSVNAMAQMGSWEFKSGDAMAPQFGFYGRRGH